MAGSLNPTLIARLSQTLRADWTRTVLARRVAAGGLVAMAGIAAIRSPPGGDRIEVVVVTRDIGPGTALSTEDVALENRLAETIPDGASADLPTVLGATLAGPARRGEVLTDVRLLSRRLTEATAGPDARIVGVHPADSALIDLVHPGDVVDVLATGGDPATDDPSPRIVASGAIVVLVSAEQNGRAADRVVLLALPASAANAVAGAALVQTVTLTLR